MTTEKKLKRQKLRNAEYYDFQAIQDELYEQSKRNKVFTNLVELITMRENIGLAYRNIKKNKGSKTAGARHNPSHPVGIVSCSYPHTMGNNSNNSEN